jgi:hypothetical protein
MHTFDFGTLMATRKTSLNMPLPFLATWIGVRLGRVLKE